MRFVEWYVLLHNERAVAVVQERARRGGVPIVDGDPDGIALPYLRHESDGTTHHYHLVAASLADIGRVETAIFHGLPAIKPEDETPRFGAFRYAEVM